ncbi:MAG: ATP-grasp domain-containing protein [Paludibacteraceae bacterium]|nr:ATP-grasp domain-containing protein [Paludibacteraceae bacterium]
MNFIFFSPHFPENSTEFCFYLKEFGANVLGIGDAAYDSLNDRLKQSLTEYYKVSDLEDYDQVLRAVGYFTHKYGKIDRFDSLNEYWLELEARIRTDFNIYGTKNDFIGNLKRKSKMKSFFQKSGVQTVRCHQYENRESALKFIAEVGYPVVVKPDSGSGANFTYKIKNEFELDAVLANKQVQDAQFIIEEFVDGIILTYDGLVDRFGNVVFENSHRFEQSIMDVVNTDDNLYYICLPEIADKVRTAGRNILKAFDVREKFFHIELFERKRDGEIVALEVNMRPPGAWMTDAINYSHDVNVYRKWASLVVRNKVDDQPEGKYFTGYASRKDHKTYKFSHQEIIDRVGNKMLYYNRIEKIFSRAMGDFAYQFRTDTYKEVKEVIDFIQRE